MAENIKRIEPPNWWIGMKDENLQLLIHGDKISEYDVSCHYENVFLKKIYKPENPNYLFLDLEIGQHVKAGKLTLNFAKPGNIHKYDYELKSRSKDKNAHQGFNSSDVIYLLMPDRFSNGNPNTNMVSGMLEKTDRNNPNGRHGGDIKGIRNHLGYFNELGVTALWLNPVLENNMPKYSYHGYAITDFYKIDARFGSNEEYKQLVKESHEKGLKIIMDMVFNHCGTGYWWMDDLPSSDWIHQFSEFTRSNYRAAVVSDPYRSEKDYTLMEKGWFDEHMADLNQDNPFLANYLIQSSIWWIEYAGIDGIRMDTYPYPQKDMMATWVKRVLNEYPQFNIVGEAWLEKEAMTAYWQKEGNNKDAYNSKLPSVTDFPLYLALIKALNDEESWTGGLMELYYVLAQDFLYSDPNMNLIFPDNHDLNRFYTSLNYNLNKFKIGLAFILTTRGIPQIYYGTEILMDGNEKDGHGLIRQDFPGGWEGDKMNAFTQLNLNADRMEAFNFTKKLLNWRRKAAVIHRGKLKHFIPEDGSYVYFRYNDEDSIMVIINKKNARNLNLSRYNENLKRYTKAKDIISSNEFTDLSEIWMEGLSVRILVLE